MTEDNTQNETEVPEGYRKEEFEKLDLKKMIENFEERGKKQINDTVGQRNFNNVLHMGLTVLTGGLYFLAYIVLMYYKDYQYSKEKGHTVKVTRYVKKEEKIEE